MNFKATKIRLAGNRKLIFRCKAAGLRVYYPKYRTLVGRWPYLGPLTLEISSKEEENIYEHVLAEIKREEEEAEEKMQVLVASAIDNLPLIAECIFSVYKEAKRQRNKYMQKNDTYYKRTGNSLLFRERYESNYCDDYEHDYYDDYAACYDDYDDCYSNYSYERYHTPRFYHRDFFVERDALNSTRIKESFFAALSRCRSLYDLKDEALEKLLLATGSKPIGYHQFQDMPRDYYEVFSYGFHLNECTASDCLGTINELIPVSERRSIAPQKAERILQAYIAQYHKRQKASNIFKRVPLEHIISCI